MDGEGLLDPPSYNPPPPSPPPHHATLASPPESDQPPVYSVVDALAPPQGKKEQPVEDVLHFLDPMQDTIPSLALRYGVPQGALRRKNNLFADHLLAGRKTILIPSEYYKGGVSLSPKPLVSEQEELRKSKIRRWMVACKVSEYDIALLYLQQANYDLDAAVEAYMADIKWETEHPMANTLNGRHLRRPGRRKFGIGAGLTGQI
ncbi:MAG: hypothetical protein Q9163_002015 [Psora crenata]